MIPYNKSYISGNELEFIRDAINSRQLSGDGSFTRRCTDWMRSSLRINCALLTNSATAALEMACLLANLEPGDEVIMPSYTFVSTANAVVLRGAIPVFVDIRPDTLNIDENLISEAITSKTKAIMPVHYAGVACEMDTIMHLANELKIYVIEDAAQGINAYYKGVPLGTIGHMGALSFHATKNISCGEGGAFLTKLKDIAEKAEIIREKGTDRSKYLRGEVDKYSWVETGSSFLPSELNAAYLAAQFEEVEKVTNLRVSIWNKYHEAFSKFEDEGLIVRPKIPDECVHNGHIYWILLENQDKRNKYIKKMKDEGVICSTHYVPLHSSLKGRIVGKTGSKMKFTDDLSSRLVRLPIYPGLESNIEYIVDKSTSAIKEIC